MKKRTKIVATVGPASDSLETITALIKAGVNVFRLNFSHGTHEYHFEVLTRIREAMKNTGLVVGILQDISGPKIRVGMLEEDFVLKTGDKIDFLKEEIIGHKVEEGHFELCINEPKILDELKVGEYIYMYDGIIRAIITAKNEEKITVEIENDGMLSSRKGVNFPNTSLGIDILTSKDRKDMLWGIEHGVDFMAISFVQNENDMLSAREIIEKNSANIQLFAKIEKFDAVENIDAILSASDGIMVARGDLGIEIPYFDVPNTQKMLIGKANDRGKPVIVATQMLLSMTTKETATRAEISDVANAVLDGTDAVMLSEESAVGHNPVLAVETMVKTISAAEKNYPFHKFEEFELRDRGDKIDEAVVRLSQSLDTGGIISMTSSGQSARKIARYRPEKPIYSVAHDAKTAQKLSIVWGVVPAFFVEKNDIRIMLGEVIDKGLAREVLDIDKTYIITAGAPVGVAGSTSLIQVISAREMEYYCTLDRKKEFKKMTI
ncbi:Pyruvate kinase [hydrothermal vent metagenome]|uniref:pyruvate kinase n=1 Tax=hydrothermal vent metagenome TaxID=652676 RepID=A0A1W1EDE5_9ZZZZ